MRPFLLFFCPLSFCPPFPCAGSTGACPVAAMISGKSAAVAFRRGLHWGEPSGGQDLGAGCGGSVQARAPLGRAQRRPKSQDSPPR